MTSYTSGHSFSCGRSFLIAQVELEYKDALENLVQSHLAQIERMRAELSEERQQTHPGPTSTCRFITRGRRDGRCHHHQPVWGIANKRAQARGISLEFPELSEHMVAV